MAANVMRPAAGPHAPRTSPEFADYNNALKLRALRMIAMAGLGGLGLGGLGAGLAGVMAERPRPFPDDDEEEAEVRLPAKLAASPPPFLATRAGDSQPAVFSPRWFRGDTQTSAASIPWAMPAAGAAAVSGLAGGHHLVRWLLRRKRRADLDAELDRAKQEYAEAMSGSPDPSRKEAAPLAAAAAVAEKAGFDLSGLVNTGLGGAAGLYGLTATGIAGTAGLGAYKYFRSRSRSKLLLDALKHRAILRALSNPAPVRVRLRRQDEGDADA